MKRLFLAGMLLSLVAPAAVACSLNTGYVPFGYDVDATAREAEPKALRTPELGVVGVVRGVGGAPGTCDGTGLLIVKLDWPGGEYDLQDIGFEFRVVESRSPFEVFPAQPVAVLPTARRGEIVFMWPDAPPAGQQPLYLQVEVRALTRDRQYGPAATFYVDTRDPGIVKEEEKQRKAEEKARRKLEKERAKEEERAGQALLN